jgi:hypothetical protein
MSARPRNGNMRLAARVLTFTLLAAAWQATIAVAGQSANPAIGSIRVGFNGHYKVGFWTPIEVMLAAGSQDIDGDLEVIVPDGDGVPTRVVERGVSLKAGEKKGTRLVIKPGRPHAPITVALRATENGATIAERTFSGDEVPAALGTGSKSGAAKLILELGSQLQFGASIRFSEEGDPEETAVVCLDDPSQWPDRWFAYDGVDLIVVTTGKAEVFSRLSAATLDALDRWLRLGGRMLISVGAHGSELLAAGKPLSRFAPGDFIKTVPRRPFAALENFAGTSAPLAAEEGGDRATIDVAKLEAVHGRIEASDDVPLVVRSGVGFGQLTFVAVDLDEPPISRWKARPEFLAALLGQTSSIASSPTSAEPRGQGMQYGYDDLIGQLRAALDQFPGVRLVPFWLVATLVVGYVLLLFPLDYLLGVKLLGRKSSGGTAWPWVRFGVIVASVSLGASLLGSRWKGDRLQGNQADMLDIDVESGLARGSSWLSVYSPSRQTYSLDLRPSWHSPHDEPVETQLSWLGLPGSGLGGMNSPPTELPLFTEPYDLSAASGTVGPVPLATWSSKCFACRWTSPGNRLVASDLHENTDRQLAGTIRLAEGAASQFELTRCVLFYDRWAYVFDSFSTAKPVEVERLDPRTAETYLTERHVVNEKDQTNPYDRNSLDRARILQIMMFYKTAGGRKYTGLLNRNQHELDFSDELTLGRAVLVGFGPPAAELEVDGRPLPRDSSAEHLTIYRFLLPVQKVTLTQTSGERSNP